MRLPLSTAEKRDYRDYWSCNAWHYGKQGCYKWMAEQLRPLQPKRVLDIGCGTGQGLLALLDAFSPDIVALEENAECIRESCDAVFTNGYPVEPVFRLGYKEFKDGTHDMIFDFSPVEASSQVTIVHADLLVDDPTIDQFLSEAPPFDAVTVWLMGTFMMRRTCRNISNLKIANANEYRLRVQNRVYQLADRVLRPGGWLHVVDRGEPPTEKFLQDDLINAHSDQARSTSLEVFDLQYREYTEPTDRGISMVATTGTSGRNPELNAIAMLSTISRKPK